MSAAEKMKSFRRPTKTTTENKNKKQARKVTASAN